MKIQSTLLCMMDIALNENRSNDAEYYANISEKTTKLYDLWEYNSYVGKFQVAISKKDSDSCVEILSEMITAMQKPWKINSSRLYQHLKEKKGEEAFSEIMIKAFLNELVNDEQSKFLKGNSKFLKIIDKYRD